MHSPEVKVNRLSLQFGWLEGHTHDDGCQGLSALFFHGFSPEDQMWYSPITDLRKTILKAGNSNNRKELDLTCSGGPLNKPLFHALMFS